MPTTVTRRPKYKGPNGKPFVWGDIIKTHQIGPYWIIESTRFRPTNAKPDWEPSIGFHFYVEMDGEIVDSHHSASSLDRALIDAIAFRNEWLSFSKSAALNSSAGAYFARMIGGINP